LNKLRELVSDFSQEFGYFFKFSVVGAIGAVVDMSLLVFLKEFIGLPLLLANAISFTAAVLNNFLWNSLWTYRHQPNKNPRRQVVQFAIVSTLGLALNTGILHLLANILGLWYILAKAIAIGVVWFWNFVMNRLWTFRGSGTRWRARRAARHRAASPSMPTEARERVADRD